jgi:hypothetical protein
MLTVPETVPEKTEDGRHTSCVLRVVLGTYRETVREYL